VSHEVSYSVQIGPKVSLTRHDGIQPGTLRALCATTQGDYSRNAKPPRISVCRLERSGDGERRSLARDRPLPAMRAVRRATVNRTLTHG